MAAISTDWVLLSLAPAPPKRVRVSGLVGANARRAVVGEPVESVVNGLDPVVRRRTPR